MEKKAPFSEFNTCLTLGIKSNEVKALKKLKRRLAVAGVCILLLAVLSVWAFSSLVPIVSERAVRYSKSRAANVISSAVWSAFEDSSYSCGDLVDIERDGEGRVLSLSLNSAMANMLKSEVTENITRLLASGSNKIIKIPVGNLSGIHLLSGRGFPLSVRLIPAESAVTSFESRFSEVGINQSRHELWVSVTLDMGVVVLGNVISVEVCDKVLVADTVIVGSVPDAYTKIEKLDSDTLGDVIDFKAG